MIEKKLNTLKEWIDESENIVFLGGAGVSTESGIPDFRGENGLYRKKRDVPLEIILSYDYFIKNPEEFYRYFRNEGNLAKTKPNAAHIKLAQLERDGKLSAVITQNVDGLHQQAGSKTVYELHGNGSRFYCMSCGREYNAEVINNDSIVPRCSCGGVIRPGVVFYGEALDENVLRSLIEAIKRADMLIVGGTSLVVYPAAGLIDYYGGDRLVLINEQATPYDRRADLIITEKIGEVFKAL